MKPIASFRRVRAGWILLFVLAFAPYRASAGDVTPSYEKDVRPILKANCFHCHGEAGHREGGLDLRLRRLIVAGGDSGPAIEPGDPESSYLLARLEAGEMPPGDTKLQPDEVATIGRWIAAGAPTLRDEPEQLDDEYITEEERSFWAFQPVVRPEVPEVRHRDQVRTPIDAFLLARLEEHDLSFSPEADRLTLLRRACFDLLGLPPTLEQIEQFLADEAPDAYDRLLDRLLASPHYGERWGRHWLDVAGYADSEGYTADDPLRPWAYKYRDYVIRSFNADKPLDEFIQEQLAGDEMIDPPYTNLSPEAIEKLTATGFLRMAPDGTGAGGVDQGVARNQVVADTIKIVSTALLGLTVGCAQCHDHRYDPISQKDYYRMRAIFEPALDCQKWRKPSQRLVSLYTDADRAEAARIEEQARQIDARRIAKQNEYIARTLERELEKIDPELREAIRYALNTPADKRLPVQKALLREYPSTNVTPGSLYLFDRKAADELKKMAAEAAKVRATKPVEEFVRCLTEVPGRVPVTHVFIRGDHEQPGEVVQPAALAILAGDNPPSIPDDDPSRSTSGRRLAYARWLTSGRHPLVARVIVNRVWMHHFGRGIVETPGDFGMLGARPTHPKLLDWLASELVEGGWRLKRLHKLIMTSTAYRQQSRRRPELQAVDADNRLYGRMSIRRLEAEAIRDAMMVASGKLERQMFGKPVPTRPDDVGQIVVGVDTRDAAGRPTGKEVDIGGQAFRRSVYVTVRRTQPLAVLEAFDAPIMEPNCKRRSTSTVTPQALLMMNSPYIRQMARHMAERVVREAGDEPRQQIEHAWLLAFSSKPDKQQLEESLGFLNRLTDHLCASVAPPDKSETKKEQPAQADAGKQATAAASAASAGGDKPPGEKASQTAAEQTGTSKPKQANDAARRKAQREALVALCQALLSSNPFLYVD